MNPQIQVWKCLTPECPELLNDRESKSCKKLYCNSCLLKRRASQQRGYRFKPLEPRFCAYCGINITKSKRRHARFCGPTCRSRFLFIGKRLCVVCKNQLYLNGRKRSRLYCSLRCQQINWHLIKLKSLGINTRFSTLTSLNNLV